MSLYMGFDNNGDPLLHVTEGERTETELKSPIPISDTLFHSGADYLSVIDVVESTSYSHNVGVTGTYKVLKPNFSSADIARLESYRSQGYLMTAVVQQAEWDRPNGRYGLVSKNSSLQSSTHTLESRLFNFREGGFSTLEATIYNALRTGGTTRPWLDNTGSWPPFVGGQLPGYPNFSSVTLDYLRTRDWDDLYGSNNGFVWQGLNTYGSSRGSIYGTNNAYNTSGSHTYNVYGYRTNSYSAPFLFGSAISITNDPTHPYSTQKCYNAGATVYWDPGLTGRNLSASPTDRLHDQVGVRCLVYIFNNRYEADGSITQDRPFGSNKEIFIDNDDLQVGNLAVKNGQIFSDPQTGLFSFNQSSGLAGNFKFDYVKRMNDNLPTGTGNMTAFFNQVQPFGGLTRNDVNSASQWEWEGYLCQDSATYLTGTVGFKMDNDELSYEDSTGTVSSIASPSTGFRLLNLVDASVTIATRSASNVTYNDMLNWGGWSWYQGQEKDLFRGSYYYLGSGQNGWYINTTGRVVATVPFPSWLQGASKAVFNVGYPTITGPYRITHSGKTEIVNMDMNPRRAPAGLRLWDTERSNGYREFANLGRHKLVAGDNCYAAELGSNFHVPAGTSNNRYQSIELRYTLEIDFNSQQFIVKEFGTLCSQSFHFGYSDGQGTRHWYCNGMGGTEVRYDIPAFKISLYPLSVS